MDTTTVEDLRNFQLHRVDAGTSPIMLDAKLTGPEFLLDIMLGRDELMAPMQPVLLPCTLPVVPSMQEVTGLATAVGRFVASANHLPPAACRPSPAALGNLGRRRRPCAPSTLLLLISGTSNA